MPFDSPPRYDHPPRRRIPRRCPYPTRAGVPSCQWQDCRLCRAPADRDPVPAQAHRVPSDFTAAVWKVPGGNGNPLAIHPIWVGLVRNVVVEPPSRPKIVPAPCPEGTVRGFQSYPVIASGSDSYPGSIGSNLHRQIIRITGPPAPELTIPVITPGPERSVGLHRNSMKASGRNRRPVGVSADFCRCAAGDCDAVSQLVTDVISPSPEGASNDQHGVG